MLLSFLFALAAGFAVPYAEPPFRRVLAAVLDTDLRIGAAETRLLTLLALLALSALLTSGFGANTVSLATVIGGGLGYFGRDLYAFLRDPDGSDVPEDARWDGQVRSPGAATPKGDAPGDIDPDAAALRAVDAAMRDAASSDSPPPADRKEPSR